MGTVPLIVSELKEQAAYLLYVSKARDHSFKQ